MENLNKTDIGLIAGRDGRESCIEYGGQVLAGFGL